MLTVVSIAALLVGSVVAGLQLGPTFTHGLFGPTFALPMDEDIQLDAGQWVIFERTGSQRRSGPLTLTQNDEAVLEKTRVAIFDPSGAPVDIDGVRALQTINRNGSIYTGVISFDAPTSGTYAISLESSSSEAIISADLGSALRASATWLIVAGLGALGCLAGVILFLTGGSPNNRSHRRISGHGPVTPVGWYPDPDAPSQLRWWNGEQWGATKPTLRPSD